MRWFIKRETFRRPAAELKQAITAHRQWVASCREQGVVISSGFLVDGEGKPGGGGLLLLQASDYAAALALIEQDPMLLGATAIGFVLMGVALAIDKLFLWR